MAGTFPLLNVNSLKVKETWRSIYSLSAANILPLPSSHGLASRDSSHCVSEAAENWILQAGILINIAYFL